MIGTRTSQGPCKTRTPYARGRRELLSLRILSGSWTISISGGLAEGQIPILHPVYLRQATDDQDSRSVVQRESGEVTRPLGLGTS